MAFSQPLCMSIEKLMQDCTMLLANADSSASNATESRVVICLEEALSNLEVAVLNLQDL